MNTLPIESSSNPTDARDRFLDEIGNWVADCIETYSTEPPTDVHDQGTYTTGWEPYIHLTGNDDALSFMKKIRDDIRSHFVDQDKWHHGYWRMQEAHHGTEHYELFLGALQRLDPQDSITAEQLVDAAEHMGNWVAEVPEWFNWETGRFHSIYFGTDGVKSNPELAFNVPDHMRCINISLLAFRASQEQRYLELAQTYAGHWARAILAEDALPIGLNESGPAYQFSTETERGYRSFAGQAPSLELQVDRAENLLSSDTANTFLYLWKQTGDTDFLAAAESLLDVLVTQIDDPDAGSAADAIRDYRRATNDSLYDAAILSAWNERPGRSIPLSLQSISLDTEWRLDEQNSRPSGIGKRADMLRWLEDGEPRRYNPITVALVAEISGDEELATRALDMGRVYLALARKVFPDGRDHGCAARSVSAVARGHGRENHAGVTTAVLAPLVEAFCPELH